MTAIDFPSSPTVGQSLTVGTRTWIWDGTVWGSQSTREFVRTVSDTAPSNPQVGDEWFNSSNGRLYNYYDGFWIEIGASVAGADGADGAPGESGLLPVESISSNVTLESNKRYFVNTTAARSLTLPASPALGDEIIIYDASGEAATNNITLFRNGNKINALEDNAIIDIDQSISVLAYTGATIGWRFE